MKVIAIEEHWNSAAIRDALDRLPPGAYDESVAFNRRGDSQARLEDIGPGRLAAMDAAGIDVSILSVVTPATQPLPAPEAVALARDANDEAADAVRAHPSRFLFATAARLRQPIFIHPQIPSDPMRDAAYRGLDPLVDLGLATFGWGWHLEAGLAALRLILRGTFDRHPELHSCSGTGARCCCSGWTGSTVSPASPSTSSAGWRTT